MNLVSDTDIATYIYKAVSEPYSPGRDTVHWEINSLNVL
jgi:hypothetical protein